MPWIHYQHIDKNCFPPTENISKYIFPLYAQDISCQQMESSSLCFCGGESLNGRDRSSAHSSARGRAIPRLSIWPPHMLRFQALYIAQWPSGEQREGQQPKDWTNYLFLNRTYIAGAGKDSV